MTFDEESYISDVAYEEKKLRNFDKQEREKPAPVKQEEQLLEEVYANIPEEEYDDAEIDNLYECYAKEQEQWDTRGEQKTV